MQNFSPSIRIYNCNLLRSHWWPGRLHGYWLWRDVYLFRDVRRIRFKIAYLYNVATSDGHPPSLLVACAGCLRSPSRGILCTHSPKNASVAGREAADGEAMCRDGLPAVSALFLTKLKIGLVMSSKLRYNISCRKMLKAFDISHGQRFKFKNSSWLRLSRNGKI